MPALGIIHDADLGNNSNGYVITSGVADNVDTSGYSEGDELYVAVGGGLTNTRPAGSTDLIQKIGTVLGLMQLLVQFLYKVQEEQMMYQTQSQYQVVSLLVMDSMEMVPQLLVL